MNYPLPANDAISVGVSYDCWWQMHDSVFAECDDADLWLCGHNSHELCDWPVHIELVKKWDAKSGNFGRFFSFKYPFLPHVFWKNTYSHLSNKQGVLHIDFQDFAPLLAKIPLTSFFHFLDFQFKSNCSFCGYQRSEWIFEVIVSPKMPTKIFPVSVPPSQDKNLEFFGWHLGRNDDLKNLFWI